MRPSEIEWDFLLRHTMLPAIALALSTVMLVGSQWLHGQQSAQYAQFSTNQDAMHQDYDALVYRRRLVDRYHERYQQFHEAGFVGQESRLDWIETLRSTTRKLLLPRVSYVIDPQLNVMAPVESILSGEDIQIHVSSMQLDMGLVHELDLLRFMDQLQSHAPGLIKIDECSLEWRGDAAATLTAEANIHSSCKLEIFSVITSDVDRESLL